MGHIIKPSKVGLVVCPNEANHIGDDRLKIKTEGGSVSLYVIRLIYEDNGVLSEYLMPPVAFCIAVLANFLELQPGSLVWIGHKACAKCCDFEDPGLWRKKYRENPSDIDFNEDDEPEYPN